MAIKPWSTVFPTSSDTLSSVQPDLNNATYSGSSDTGDVWLNSHLHTLRDKLQAVCDIVGDNTKPAGSLQNAYAGANATSYWSWMGSSIQGAIAKWGSSNRGWLNTSSIVLASDDYIMAPSGSNWGNSGSAHNVWHRVTGSLMASGSQITLSGSNRLFLSSSQIHISPETYGIANITGSMHVSGNLLAQGLSVVQMGSPPTGMTSSFGVGTSTNHTSTPFAVYANRANGAHNESVRISADVNSTSINADHVICSFGWLSSGPEYTGSWLVKKNAIQSAEAATAELIGTISDGYSSIGSIVGSSASFLTSSTANSKILSIRNVAQERECVYYDLGKRWGTSNYGSYVEDRYYSEILQIASGGWAYTQSYITTPIPSGSAIKSVGMMVITSLPTGSLYEEDFGRGPSATASIDVGISGTIGIKFGTLWGRGISITASANNATSSLAAGWVYCPTASYVGIKFNCPQGNAVNTGSVRIECYYRVLNPPTS